MSSDVQTSGPRYFCGCGEALAQGQLVCGACWRAAPDWMRRGVASRYANQKAEARVKLLAFAASRKPQKTQNTLKGVKCPLCDHYMAYEEDRDCDGNHLQRPWYECEQCEWKQPVDSQLPMADGQGEQAGRLRDGRPEACATTVTLDEARTSMLRFCAWCKGFMGSKPGEGVTYGICPACQAREEKALEDLNLNLGDRSESSGGGVSSIACSTRTSLASPADAPADRSPSIASMEISKGPGGTGPYQHTTTKDTEI